MVVIMVVLWGSSQPALPSPQRSIWIWSVLGREGRGGTRLGSVWRSPLLVCGEALAGLVCRAGPKSKTWSGDSQGGKQRTSLRQCLADRALRLEMESETGLVVQSSDGQKEDQSRSQEWLRGTQGTWTAANGWTIPTQGPVGLELS